MRTSLNEIKYIEAYLLEQSNVEERLKFEARLITNEGLRTKTTLQKQVHEIIKSYGRQQLRGEIEEVHQELFSKARHLAFKNNIYRIFNFST